MPPSLMAASVFPVSIRIYLVSSMFCHFDYETYVEIEPKTSIFALDFSSSLQYSFERHSYD